MPTPPTKSAASGDDGMASQAAESDERGAEDVAPQGLPVEQPRRQVLPSAWRMSGFSVSLVAFTKLRVSKQEGLQEQREEDQDDEPWCPRAGRVDELLVLGADDSAGARARTPRGRRMRGGAAPRPTIASPRAGASSVSRTTNHVCSDRERGRWSTAMTGSTSRREAILDEVRAELADVQRERCDVETDEEQQRQDERRQQVDAL